MNEDIVGNAISKYWDKAWGVFSWIGNLMSGCMGIYFSLKIIKFLVDTSIHAWALYPLYGLSWHLIGMFWDTVTYCLVHQNNKQKDNPEFNDMANNKHPEFTSSELQEIKVTDVVIPSAPIPNQSCTSPLLTPKIYPEI